MGCGEREGIWQGRVLWWEGPNNSTTHRKNNMSTCYSASLVVRTSPKRWLQVWRNMLCHLQTKWIFFGSHLLQPHDISHTVRTIYSNHTEHHEVLVHNWSNAYWILPNKWIKAISKAEKIHNILHFLTLLQAQRLAEGEREFPKLGQGLFVTDRIANGIFLRDMQLALPTGRTDDVSWTS